MKEDLQKAQEKERYGENIPLAGKRRCDDRGYHQEKKIGCCDFCTMCECGWGRGKTHI